MLSWANGGRGPLHKGAGLGTVKLTFPLPVLPENKKRSPRAEKR